jgi:hypothetical protein
MIDAHNTRRGEKLRILEGQNVGKIVTFERAYLSHSLYALAENGITLHVLSANIVEKVETSN